MLQFSFSLSQITENECGKCVCWHVHAERLTFFCRLYNVGLQPKLARLYQKVNFPVARGTPMLASMVKWDHSMEWSVASFGGKVN